MSAKRILSLLSIAAVFLAGAVRAEDVCSLSVEWNNPFSPGKGERTEFRCTASGEGRQFELRVFDISGDLVREWPAFTAAAEPRDYMFSWSGTNADGRTVAPGIYLVNLRESGASDGVTRKIAVVR